MNCIRSPACLSSMLMVILMVFCVLPGIEPGVGWIISKLCGGNKSGLIDVECGEMQAGGEASVFAVAGHKLVAAPDRVALALLGAVPQSADMARLEVGHCVGDHRSDPKCLEGLAVDGDGGVEGAFGAAGDDGGGCGGCHGVCRLVFGSSEDGGDKRLSRDVARSLVGLRDKGDAVKRGERRDAVLKNRAALGRGDNGLRSASDLGSGKLLKRHSVRGCLGGACGVFGGAGNGRGQEVLDCGFHGCVGSVFRSCLVATGSP